ncbi:MDR family MFS transporter [Streptomyces tsukubensis]|uniref:MFS transporter n=1 Tax=Streptomyces tsukubensis TaxID=83656 RepID=A0A1V4A2M8_9ACTN|nr:MDR family MFS transporter [Streptomyces tsukubensis]OON73272.1 MFS transporter [Streptomyces tsukubensis]QFR94534.1 DHA2 family efflux MFS transporter permease subunit [Streptomyces tsukubensis]
MTETAKTGAPSPDSGAGTVDARRMRLIMLGLLLGLFMSALDQTIISAALRTIADDLGGLSEQAWANTSYMITSVITTALYGKLSDIYGRRPVYCTAVGVFVLGSVLCALAPSMTLLAVFRGIQGVGAGGLMSLAFAILTDLVPLAERSRYQAWFGAVFGVAAVIGPVAGGFFAGLDSFLGATGWRWAFYINVPIGLAAALLIGVLVRVQPHRTRHKFDIAGLLALVTCLLPLLFAVEQGPKWGWGDGGTLALFGLGVIGLALFLLAQKRAGGAALLPTPMFRNPVFSVYNGVNILVGAAVFGALSVLPLYLQIVKGLSPTQAGLMMLPQTLGIVVAGRIAGPYVTKTGRYKVVLLSGLVLMVIATFWFSTLTADTALWRTAVAAGVMGFGIGLCWQVMLIAIQTGVEPRYMGAGMGSFTFFRQIGGTAGIAVFLSMFFGAVTEKVTAAYRDAPSDPAYAAAVHDPSVTGQAANKVLLGARDGDVPLDNSSFLDHADARLAKPFLHGMAEAMQTVFVVSGVMLVIALVLAAIPREKRGEPAAAPGDAEGAGKPSSAKG